MSLYINIKKQLKKYFDTIRNEKIKANNLLTRLLILILYVAFFFVQLLFNFDFSVYQKSNDSTSFTESIQNTNSKQHILKQAKTSIAKNNIRLNKRFEPKSIGDCDFPVVVLFVKYTSQISSGAYYGTAVLRSFLLTQSLRGPPVIA